MGSGKKKIAMRKIENLQYRRVAFCKRRKGLFSKSRQLSTLTPGCRVAVLAFSTSNTPHFFDNDNDDDGDDDTDNLVSFLEQAADAVFRNPNFAVGNSNPSFSRTDLQDVCGNGNSLNFEIGSNGDSLRVGDATAFHDNGNPHNFEIGSTDDSLRVEDAILVHGKGDPFPSPSFETVGGDPDLNLGDEEKLLLTEEELLELMGSDDEDEAAAAAPAPNSICSAPEGFGSCSTMTDESCTRNAVPFQHCYSDHSIADTNAMNLSGSTDVMRMQDNMTKYHTDWSRYTLQQEIIPNSPSCPPVEQFSSAAYTYTDDLRQIRNNTNSHEDGCNRNAVPQQIISNSSLPRQQCYYDHSAAYAMNLSSRTNLMWNNTNSHEDGCNRNAVPQQIISNSSLPLQQCYYDHSAAYAMNLSSSTDLMQRPYEMTTSFNDLNRYALPQEIIPNSPSCPPLDHYYYDQTAAYTYTDDYNYMLNYVPGELMMQFAASSSDATSTSNAGLWSDDLSGLLQLGSGDGCGNGDEDLKQLFLRKQRLEALTQSMLLNSSSYCDTQWLI